MTSPTTARSIGNKINLKKFLTNNTIHVIILNVNKGIKKKGKVLTMTNREFFEAIINGTITEEVITHAHESIAKLDARNAKRAATPSKKAIENAPIIEAIKGVLTNEPQTASEIAEKVGIKVQKASALCRQIIESGFASVTDVKVKGKGTVKGYFVE